MTPAIRRSVNATAGIGLGGILQCYSMEPFPGH